MRLHVLPIIVGYILILLLDWYIWNDFRKMSVYSWWKPEHKKRHCWDKVFLIFSALVLADLTVAISLPVNKAGVGFQPVTWMLYVFLTILTAEIFYFVISLLGRLPWLFAKKGKTGGYRRCNTGLWIGLPIAVVVFCAMWYGTVWGRQGIQVNEVEVVSPRLPESFNGYTVAQISDLHVGTWGEDTTFIARLVDRVNELHPDLIVFTGDVVNREASELKPFMSVLSRLKAPDGVLSVLGNHDYGDYIRWSSPLQKVENMKLLRSSQGEMGWRLLDNEHKVIGNEKGDSIMVIGVGNWGEPPFPQYGDLNKAYPENSEGLKGLNDNNFKILLSHNPEHWNRQVSKVSNIDLTLAGHTHAMQIMLKLGNWKWSPSQYRYEQWGGLYKRPFPEGESNLYVNIGAGEVGLPMRIGATPEITLFKLRNKQ